MPQFCSISSKLIEISLNIAHKSRVSWYILSPVLSGDETELGGEQPHEHATYPFQPPLPTFRVAKLASRRGLFALLAIGLLAAGVAGFFMSGAVVQAQEQEMALPSHYDTDGDGLIEIGSLDQLNAARWDLDGNGVPSDRQRGRLFRRFPGSRRWLGMPRRRHLHRLRADGRPGL